MSDGATRPRILIVDDAPVNIRLLVHGLSGEYEIRVAASGADALEIVDAEAPDLILLDVVMHDMSGHEVCRKLKENPQTQSIPIIFITGKRGEADEIEGLSLGAVDFIAKPFSLPIVQARVRTHMELKRYRDLLERFSYVDGLTGIPNRRRFDEYFELAWALAARQRSALAVILLDVDHFKAFNDHYGHRMGDECLRRVGQTLLGSKRRVSDLIARYGGEEFVCLLPGAPLEGAVRVAEVLRSAVEAIGTPHAHSGVSGCITVSVGVAAAAPVEGQARAGLLEAADQALYRAKACGRNRVCS